MSPLLGLVVAFVLAGDDERPRAVAEITKVDVGEIPCGKPAIVEFSVSNTGTRPLELSAKPRCGCTVVDCEKSIPPGGVGTIKAELRTSSLRGRFEKSVDVETNDPERPSLRLTLTGRVFQAVELKPSRNPSAVLAGDGPTTLQVELQTIEGVAVTDARCAVPYAQAELLPQEGRAYRLSITVQPEAPWGRSNFVVMIGTTAEYQRQIPVTVSCEKGIVVAPASFGFTGRRRGRDAPATSMVMLRKTDGNLRIRKAESSDPNLEIDVVPLKDGAAYRLIARCRGDVATLGPTTMILIETDDLRQPRIEIPVRTPRP